MKLWIWRWIRQSPTDIEGYNSCRANTREEALAKARAMETKYLKLNESTLHEGTFEELDRLDKAFDSLFW